MREVIRRVWESILFGENVLIEHDSSTPPHIGFAHLLNLVKLGIQKRLWCGCCGHSRYALPV